MSKKTRSKTRSYPMEATDCCVENIEHIKARYKVSKQNLKAIETLALNNAFDYELRDEILGRAYNEFLRNKEDYKRAKARK